MTADWRNLDATARERAYSPSSCIGGNYQPFVKAYSDLSRLAHAAPRCQRNLAYGTAPRQVLDLFVPDLSPAPGATLPASRTAAPALLVFIHGGYWQELSKDESAFSAVAAMAHGLAFAAIDYTLAPQASVAEMVGECRRALAWLHGHAAELGFDAHRIVVAGSSAGAHLAAMTAMPGAWAEAAGPGAALGNPVRAVVLVSGIYELEPLIGTSINSALGLSLEAARAISPALQALPGFPTSVVCWGEVETDEFKRQSRDFAAQLSQADTACTSFEIPLRNHFDVILDLVGPGTLLGHATLELMHRL